MDTQLWKKFLSEYSEVLLRDPKLERRASIPSHARSSSWLGFQPATEKLINDAEERLALTLPPSLRSFYLVSNGWSIAGNFIFAILPVEEIGWLRTLEPSTYDLLSEDEERVEDVLDSILREAGGFVGSPDTTANENHQNLEKRLRRSILVSGASDGDMFVLDPQATNEGGEWAGNVWNAWHPDENWNSDGFAGVFRELRDSYIPHDSLD